jgi:hypothetical protein
LRQAQPNSISTTTKNTKMSLGPQEDPKRQQSSSTTTDIPTSNIGISSRDGVNNVPSVQGVLKEPQTPVTHTPPLANVDIERVNQRTRASLVNILCTTARGGSFRPITGTGVIINEQGVILTNAHVAQYLLLADYALPGEIDCLIRTGSPAQARYRAELIYISSEWIEKNRYNLTEQNPVGTGEHDYAFLQILRTSDPTGVLPTQFPALELAYEESVLKNDSVLIAAYPAGFLGGIAVQKDLYINSTIAKIGELFTFSSGSIDLFSLGGTIVAQKGASGGAVVHPQTEKLTGIIVTNLEAPTTDARDLRALSLAYIVRTFKEETGISMSDLFNNTGTFKTNFQRTEAPRLAKILIEALQ